MGPTFENYFINWFFVFVFAIALLDVFCIRLDIAILYGI